MIRDFAELWRPVLVYGAGLVAVSQIDLGLAVVASYALLLGVIGGLIASLDASSTLIVGYILPTEIDGFATQRGSAKPEQTPEAREEPVLV